jgi:hypothetical protein
VKNQKATLVPAGDASNPTATTDNGGWEEF